MDWDSIWNYKSIILVIWIRIDDDYALAVGISRYSYPIGGVDV